MPKENHTRCEHSRKASLHDSTAVRLPQDTQPLIQAELESYSALLADIRALISQAQGRAGDTRRSRRLRLCAPPSGR